jgi:hypothetical protein
LPVFGPPDDLAGDPGRGISRKRSDAANWGRIAIFQQPSRSHLTGRTSSMRMGYRFSLLAAALLASASLHAADDKPAFSIKTPIEQIAANPDARAVLERELPGFTALPQYDQFKSMSLETLEAMFPDAIPHERIKAIDAALRAIPAPGKAPKDTAPAAAPTPAQSQ